MKRFILLAACLLAASACASNTTTPSGNTNWSASNANTTPANTITSATPATEALPPAAALISQEKQVWDMIRTKKPDGFAAMLADDFIYVSNDGVYNKAETVGGMKQISPTDITLSDWKTVMLGKDAGVVVYTVNMKGTSGGNPIPPGAMRGGSVWVNRGGKWVGAFHQDTPPPGNAASAKRTPQAATPVESRPAEPVSDDAIAREKQVWDAIKKKDYDRFASFLADDQLEVFAWSVNDKAGSVEGIKRADLSRATLSDFKTLKISDDAVIVMYMIKGSGDISPNGARATTAWARREGKWLAVYHQDTTVKK